MFASHVMYQSAEKGSMPFGGDTPFTSRYNRIIRSRDSVNSLSSTCIRAPSSISAIARKTSWASSVRLFLSMARSRRSNELFGWLTGQQDGCMRRRNVGVLRGCRQRRQHGVVIEPEEAKQLVRRRQLDDLRQREPRQKIGKFLRQTQPEHPDCPVVAQHALCEHDVRQVDFSN